MKLLVRPILLVVASLFLTMGLLLLFSFSAQADTITVTTNNDSGPGSLRQALLSANVGDTITFDSNAFPPADPATITLLSPLPEITTNGLTIAGSGAGVILDGRIMTEAGTDSHGLRVRADNVTISSLQIVNFKWSGIRVYSNSANTTIEENTIGGNGNDGIRVRGSGISSTRILHNLLGTDASGTETNGNDFCGVSLGDGASDSLIEGNVIAHNGRDGVRVEGADTLGNTITQNSITANDDLGINNAEGGNGELAPPIITTVTNTTIQGHALPGVTIELFTDPFFEGQRFLASAIADAGGYFTATLAAPLTEPLVTATATDAAGNTSEFAAFCQPELLELPIIWPYCSEEPPLMSSPFGPRLMASQEYRYDFHRGVDLPAPLRTPFYAIRDGTVTEVVNDPIDLDGTIQIRHTEPETYYSRYRHVAQSSVTIGQEVSKGMPIGLAGESKYSGFDHIHLEIRDEPGIYEKYSVNPFGRMPYEDTNDYKIRITQMSADRTDLDSPNTVLLTVTGPRQELDLNQFTVSIDGNERALDFNTLNRTRTPAPNNTEPDVLDNPYQDDICIMPAPFNTSSEVYRLDLAFHRMSGILPAIVVAQAADLFSNTVTATSFDSGELLLTPAVVTATTPAGRWVIHSHTLTNASPTTQVYTLTARSAQSWTVTVEPSVVTVAPDESVDFTTSVYVPDNEYIVDGTVDCVVVEVASLVREVYLPIILKNWP